MFLRLFWRAPSILSPGGRGIRKTLLRWTWYRNDNESARVGSPDVRAPMTLDAMMARDVERDTRRGGGRRPGGAGTPGAGPHERRRHDRRGQLRHAGPEPSRSAG